MTARSLAAESLIGRLLIAVTYLSAGLLAIGVILMVAHGISPTSGGPALNVPVLGAWIVGLDASGFLWLGLLAVIAAPIGRVIVAGIAYGRDADWLMVGVSVGIVLVIGIGVAYAMTVSG